MPAMVAAMYDEFGEVIEDPPPQPAPSSVTLSDEQERAVSGILQALKRGQREITLGGYAGTGKTTTVRFLLEGLYNWAVCAFTGKAANVLRRKGIEAKTIHSLIYVPYEDKDGIKYRLRDGLDCAGILVDEASMVGADIYRDLRSFHLPMIFVGDHGQLEPVGSAVNLMAEPQFTLETIHRNAGDIAVFAESLRMGRPIIMHNEQVDVRPDLRTSVACEADQVICAYNRTRMTVNALIRKALGRDGNRPEPGDRAMCLRNNREIGLYNGQQGIITGVRTVRRSHYLDFECEGTVYPAVWYDPDQFGKEKVESNGRLNVQTPLPFDYAYCCTAHKMQGSEADTVVVIEQRCDRWDHRRWAYTAASRARLRLIWVSGTRGVR